MRAIVFGATESGKSLYRDIQKKYEIVAFADNDKNKWGKKIDGISIVSPEQITSMKWDEVIITSLSSMSAIKDQLIGGGYFTKPYQYYIY